jgi:hypothetical protein
VITRAGRSSTTWSASSIAAGIALARAMLAGESPTAEALF